MLSGLRVQGLALVERIELDFDPGLNVLTGETGAGKSLILGSIALLLGERADPDWLRAGEERGFVEGVFDLTGREDLLDAVRALEIDPEEGRVIVRRELTGDGKSRAFVNGRTVLLSHLRTIGNLLVDLHGQHEHQLLLHPENQTEFYDGWAGLLDARVGLGRERAEILAETRGISEARAAMERDRAEESRMREDLAELNEAALHAGEEESLQRERERLRHRERTIEALRSARESLVADEGGAEVSARRAARTLRSATSHTPDLSALADQAEALLDSLRGVAACLEDRESFELEEPLPLDRIETRLDRIHRLRRKHATDFEGLLALRDSLQKRVLDLTPGRDGIDARERALAARASAFEKELERLLEKRAAEKQRFEREIQTRLAKLGFRSARLSVEIVDRGRERPMTEPAPIPGIELRFLPNPGEPPRPLQRIASGGELSRVMLAIKSLMAERDRVATLVFDEVDQGIGGAVGEEVGKMLRAIAGSRQVLCITHLPLIAAHGTKHFEVLKSTVRGRTTTGVRPLEGSEREEEISRLLAGARVSETTRKQAREILHAARESSKRDPANVRTLNSRQRAEATRPKRAASGRR